MLNLKYLLLFFEIRNPIEQFIIISYGGVFTNVVITLSFVIICLNYNYNLSIISLKKSNLYYSLNTIVDTLVAVFKNNLSANVIIYFPTMIVIFITLLCANVIGMFPFCYTITSLWVVAFFFSFGIISATTFIGCREHREEFLLVLLPPNSPLLLVPALVLVELISYITRLFSLSIRLFANMTAGHMLLKIVVSASYNLISSSTLTVYAGIYILPGILIFLILLLESIIAVVQAYIFTVLSVIYTDNALNMH